MATLMFPEAKPKPSAAQLAVRHPSVEFNARAICQKILL